MATLRKRKTQTGYTWQALIRLKGHKEISRSFDLQEDAKSWAVETERQLKRGTYQSVDAAQRTTLKEAIERYRDDVLPTLSQGAPTDRYRTARLIEAFGDLSLATLNTSHVSQYRDKRLKKDSAAPATVKKELGLLNRVLKYCDIDLAIHLPTIVTEKVRNPKIPEGRSRRLHQGEEEKLLKAAQKSRSKDIEPIIIIAIETAARRGEIFQMKWEQIDLERKIWAIPAKNTKTQKSRVVPLSVRAVNTLRKLQTGKVKRLDGKVWSISRPDGITQAFDRICRPQKIVKGEKKKLDLFPDLHFHDLRHEGTSRLFEKGFSIMKAASITGHEDLQSLKRYTHLRGEDSVEEMG